MRVQRYIDWFGDGSVLVTDVALACCALEFEAAWGSADRPTVTEVPPGARLVVTLSGTLTDAVASLVAEIIARQPVSPHVVAFGACASAGGPYWDSYAVTKGCEPLVQVDTFVPGCPPPPEALEDVLATLREGAA